MQGGIDLTLRGDLVSVQFDLVSDGHRQMFRTTRECEYGPRISQMELLKMAMLDSIDKIERQIESGTISPLEREGLGPGEVKNYKLKGWTIEPTKTRTVR